jgi:hypothetical protein
MHVGRSGNKNGVDLGMLDHIAPVIKYVGKAVVRGYLIGRDSRSVCNRNELHSGYLLKSRQVPLPSDSAGSDKTYSDALLSHCRLLILVVSDRSTLDHTLRVTFAEHAASPRTSKNSILTVRTSRMSRRHCIIDLACSVTLSFA